MNSGGAGSAGAAALGATLSRLELAGSHLAALTRSPFAVLFDDPLRPLTETTSPDALLNAALDRRSSPALAAPRP